ncbi:hypothetical protein GCM10007874_23780 [Labrys miyagiensis]|uniref:Uncharacterized protein n=1 Tax=Labrys miyagiensis TaxID=346912 RepID=A0ABQ6CGA3_9HYPH|nr:hypothetical protein GCM10007874_23780 [Labrys miyagiensis]
MSVNKAREASPTKLGEVALRSNDGGGVVRIECEKQVVRLRFPRHFLTTPPPTSLTLGHLPQLRGGGFPRLEFQAFTLHSTTSTGTFAGFPERD